MEVEMSSKDTAILEYAKYIEDDNKLRYNILREKGLDVKPNQNLTYYSLKTNELSNVDNIIYDYIPDKLYNQLEDEFKKDQLREENGGEFKYCSYFLFLANTDSTYVGAKWLEATAATPIYLYTSDGQEIIKTDKAALSIIWNKPSDLKLEDGRLVRFVKIYSASERKLTFRAPDSEEANTTSNLLFSIYDSRYTTDSSTNYDSEFFKTPVEYIILGKNVTDFKVYNVNGLRYVKHLGGSLVVDIKQSGNNELFVERIDANITGILSTSNKPYLYLKYVNWENANAFNLTSLDFNYAKQVDLPPIINKLSNINLQSVTSLLLPYILDTTTLSNIKCINLKHLEFKSDTIFVRDLIITACRALTRQSLLNIFNHLIDNINSTTKTLTISIEQFLKLNDEDIEIVTNKNWTISIKYE